MSKEGSGFIDQKKAGLEVTIDFAGNIIGKRQVPMILKPIDLKSYRHGARWR
jgi:hypothetical protein